ncbi:MAG: zinc ABC transporter substrate-binding protein [Acidimicrobiales bacterium]|nr:zinc ABC transporter substrate-binding protein [Acidimicrobiales bacterium]
MRSRVRVGRFLPLPVALVCVLAASLTACGSTEGSSGSGGRPSIVVTTDVLGDVVSTMFGDAADVTVLMPPGASPHEFQASARQAAELREADLVVVNGGGLEAGLTDVVEAARDDGVPIHEATSTVDPTPGVHVPGHEHEHENGADPHFASDPVRMAQAAKGILVDAIRLEPSLDTKAVRDRAGDYLAKLAALDSEVRKILAPIPADRRLLVTNHDSFASFADRYDFTVVGAVIPSMSTADSASARDLARLAATIRERHVPAIFADTSSPARLADRLASDAAGVKVVALYSESLGKPGSGADTYLGMVGTNARRIADALA